MGAMMPENGQDKFLEEIDSELRSLNKRLKNVMSEADALLMEHQKEGQEEESAEVCEAQNKESLEDAENEAQ
jgi:hypothetical protein